MKTTVIASLASVVFLICSPLFLIKGEVLPTAASVFDIEAVEKVEKPDIEDFKIKVDDEIKTLSAKEYITGVLCGEVSPLYEKEALKAQAVAAYTFALRRAAYAKSIDREYDLTDDPATDQCYVEKGAAAEKWGEKADEYYSALEAAVEEVLGEWLSFEDSPALTVYHAISPGMTNCAEDVWNSALPYLVSVDSIGDKLSSAYLSTAEFSADELAEGLKSLCDITDRSSIFSDINKAKSGLCLTLTAGGKTLKGTEVAAALSLKSAAFDIEEKDGKYTFTVYGKGHGVGMSQTGAQYMAKQGSNYKEILLHYYKGCKLKKS